MNPQDGRRIFFVSPHSLLDRSSGAAMSVRTLLVALAKKNWRAGALQATIFDAPSGGAHILKQLSASKEQIVRLTEQGVEHYVMRTKDTHRLLMTAFEQERFLHHFRTGLKSLRPDVVLTYGGYLLDRSLILEAREHGKPVIFYLANGNYHTPDCFKNVDLIVSDSRATSELYKERFGLAVRPVGKFIDSDQFIAAAREPKYVTFVNPSFAKGANLFATLARVAAQEIPEAQFLVVQSREGWSEMLNVFGVDPATFSNVRVVPLQLDMRAVYSQTRVLLVPSLWHESGARVITEALLNGIPVLASNSGGISEMLRGTGFLFEVPATVKQHVRSPAPSEAVAGWIQILNRLVRDEAFYRAECAKAYAAAQGYLLDDAVSRFLELAEPLTRKPDLEPSAAVT